MAVIPGTYLPETYNFTVAAIVGLVIVILVVGFFLGSFRSKNVKRRPE